MSDDTHHDAPSRAVETDRRFPWGMGKGWYVQLAKYEMQVEVTFREGTITARGRDAQLGAFTLRGRYSVDDGRCHWTKVYDALTGANHHVFYQGFNEGRGIWGTWELPS